MKVVRQLIYLIVNVPNLTKWLKMYLSSCLKICIKAGSEFLKVTAVEIYTMGKKGVKYKCRKKNLKELFKLKIFSFCLK